MRKLHNTLILSLVVLTGAAMTPAANAADMKGGFVYTMTNGNDGNAIAVFARHMDGSLKMVGDPIPTGGNGFSSGDVDDQGSIAISGDMLFAVNAGSNSISVFRRMGGGKLERIGEPTDSKGHTPISVTVKNGMVFVANQAVDGETPNISGFKLSMDGTLTPDDGATVEFEKGAGPAEVSFSPDGKALAVTYGFQKAETSMVGVYKVSAEGKLAPISGSPMSSGDFSGSVGFSWAPSGKHLFVSNFRGSGIAVFNLDKGMEKLDRGMGMTDNEQAACWTTLSSNGKFLYVANFVSNSISTFSVSGDGALKLMGTTKLSGHTSPDTKDLSLSPDGKFLYAIASGDRHIHAFRIGKDGMPSELMGDMSHVMVPGSGSLKGLIAD